MRPNFADAIALVALPVVSEAAAYLPTQGPRFGPQGPDDVQMAGEATEVEYSDLAGQTLRSQLVEMWRALDEVTSCWRVPSILALRRHGFRLPQCGGPTALPHRWHDSALRRFQVLVRILVRPRLGRLSLGHLHCSHCGRYCIVRRRSGRGHQG